MMKHANILFNNAQCRRWRKLITNDGEVSVSFVYPIVKTIVSKGFNKDDFFAMANINNSMLNDPEARLSGEDFGRITELAAEMTSDEAFGLHQGQCLEVSDLGVLGYVMLHSKTIGQALEAYQKYNVIVCSGFNLSWEMEGDDVIMMATTSSPHQQVTRHCVEDMLCSVYHLMIRLSCRSISLRDVHFTHALSSDIDEYTAVLGITPQFCQASNRLRMSKDIVDYPILFADTKLLATFELIAEEAKRKLMQGRVFSDQLYSWIIRCMPVAIPSLRDTALAFKMSVRSTQALLKQENTTYQAILNQARRELAMGYLAKPEYKVGEVAYLLHFSEPSAFQSAFKKWTGITPRQYRMDSSVRIT